MNGLRATDPYHDFSAAQWETAREDASNLVLCKQNWNGEGALPARPGLVDATVLFMLQLDEQGNPAPSDVYLAPDGTPLLEWHFGNGMVTIANVRATTEAEFTFRQPGRGPQFLTVPILAIPPAPTTPVRWSNDPVSYDDGSYELAA